MGSYWINKRLWWSRKLYRLGIKIITGGDRGYTDSDIPKAFGIGMLDLVKHSPGPR